MRRWLKIARQESNSLTQNQLARLAGISRTMVTEIENGNANPSVDVAKKIANALGFDWTLFYQDGDEQADGKEAV